MSQSMLNLFKSSSTQKVAKKPKRFHYICTYRAWSKVEVAVEAFSLSERNSLQRVPPAEVSVRNTLENISCGKDTTLGNS